VGNSLLLGMHTEGGFEHNLLFIDLLPEDDLIKLYSASDLVVSSSLHESFGLVTLEAMACGRPVVSTSTGVVPDLELDGVGGIVVSPGNVGELAEAIVKLLSLNDEDRKAAARRNREFVEAEFSVAQWVDRVVEVYEKALREEVKYRSGTK